MTKISTQSFSIGEAARICGVSAKQIRFWESRGFIPTANRINLGQRSFREYSEADLNLIKRIKMFLDEGYSLAMAVKKAAEKI